MVAHDEIVAAAVGAMQRADRAAILGAFVGSLSTRNLPARSAFGSYVVLQHFAAHPSRASEEFGKDTCAYCGLPPKSRSAETDDRIRAYPFQVQHTDIRYAAHDLATFANRDVTSPTPGDIGRLRGLLDALRSLPATAQLTELNKGIGKAIRSNKFERMILLETFGHAGILCPPSKDHYGKTFVTYEESNLDTPPEKSKQEWKYPVQFWTGKDGVDEEWVDRLFGAFLRDDAGK